MFEHAVKMFKFIPPWAILGVGMLTGSLRTIWDFIYEHTIGYAINLVSLSLTVEDSEHRDAYIWLSTWLERNLKTRGISSLLLRRSHATSDSSDLNAHDRDYSLIPHYGTYYMKYHGFPMVVTHWKEEQTMPGQRKMHSIWFQVWFTRKRKLMLDLLTTAREEYLATLPKAMDFYRWSSSEYEFVGVQLPLRSMESVYLPDEMLDSLLTDMRYFLDNQKVYEDLGTPYRRGYLIKGPPGTGKTTTIVAIASHLNLPVYAINLSSAEMDGDKLSSLLNSCAKPSIVLLEDADCVKVTATREREDTGDAPGLLTLGDLLNALDGIGASEGRMVFMTTNHPEKLDPALVRTGRIDRKFHLGYAEDTELRRFYDRVQTLTTVPPWEEFRAALPEETTIADAQALAFQGKFVPQPIPETTEGEEEDTDAVVED